MLSQIEMLTVSAKPMSILVDLRELADQIMLEHENRLIAPPKGIYIKTKLEPVLRDGNYYFEQKPNGELVKITDINAVTGAIFDDKDRRLVPQYIVKNKANGLSETPFLPYVAIKICRLMYEHAIDSRIRYRKTSSRAYDKIARYFNEEIEVEDAVDMLREFQILVDKEVMPLINDHEWHHFFFRDRGVTSLQVERGEDFRVAYFMERYESGEIKL